MEPISTGLLAGIIDHSLAMPQAARATHEPSRTSRLGLSVGIAIAALCLTGCDDPNSNGALRVRLFDQCMRALPAGPRTTQYNDWDEVVDACDGAATFQARMCGKDAQACFNAASGTSAGTAETRDAAQGQRPAGPTPNGGDAHD